MMRRAEHGEAAPADLSRLSVLLALAGLGVVGVLWIYSAITIVDLRDRAWAGAADSSGNLLRSVERTLARDIELYDLSLQAVADRLRSPRLESVSPEIRQMSLFDRAAQAHGYGSIFVLDQYGEAFIDSGSVIPRKLNAADRLYFTVHRDRPDAGLFIGRPWRTRISKRDMIPLSRRFAYADGTFAGVVVGAIELAYFESVFRSLNTDPDLDITIFFDDGTVLAGHPNVDQFPNRAGLSAEDTKRLYASRAGHFLSRDEQGGDASLHTHMQVADRPIRVSVSLPVETIEAAWRPKAMVLGLVVALLSCGLLALLLLLRRELARRLQAERLWLAAKGELARLALVDGLTGLWNRRHFDHALTELERTKWRHDVSVLVIDVDNFKAYNDRYGHPAGDLVLKTVGGILERRSRISGGQAFRIGGEEFAVLISEASETDAYRVAEDLRAGIERDAIPHAAQPPGVVTVSVGLMHNARHPLATAAEWLSLADEALYRAKRAGRNRVTVTGVSAPLTPSAQAYPIRPAPESPTDRIAAEA